MKAFRSLFFVGFCALFSVMVFAQDDYDDEPCYWGIVFNMQEDFTVGKVNLGTYRNGTDEVPVFGIGLEKFLNRKWSVTGDFSIGIGDSSQENQNNTVDFSQTEIGLRLGAKYYFRGWDKTISPYVGAWASYVSYSETFTNEPQNGNKIENEFSSSTIGIGITGGAYFRPWDDVGLSIGAGYNIGYFNTPASTIKNTNENNSVETDGPSFSRFTDCGAQLMLRYDF